MRKDPVRKKFYTNSWMKFYSFMNMLKAIALDDEPVALGIIKKLSADIEFISLQAVFTNAFEAKTYLANEKTDLLFLDIKMPDISGIDLLKLIPDPPMVIFTTAYSEHAVQSFELNAVDYLLKPFSAERFLKACTKAQELYNLQQKPAIAETFIFIRTGYEQVKIELDDVLFVQSAGNYVQFVMKSQKIISRLTMNEAEQLLPPSLFTRIHRSYIVADKQVSKIERNAVWIGDAVLPAGNGFSSLADKISRRI